MPAKAQPKPLRFAVLVRVSTETQERQGESLNTQRKQNERDVTRLGGRVVEWFGGQEHATPGWEKGEVDRLIAAVGKGSFDAVIVATADRWSRDNAKSKEGLDALRAAGVQFFVGSMKMDLFDPQHRFILGMHAEVGEFIALQNAKKSIENKVERAKRGYPTCGKMPPGRTFDRETGKWGIDTAVQEKIAEIAARYLKGEKLTTLAEEYGMSRSNIIRTLRNHCGEVWEQEFKSDRLNISEVILTRIPRLLDEPTIRAVHLRLTANRTHLHGAPKHDYLLNGRVFCAVCGHALTGQVTPHGRRYYRHAHNKYAGGCPLRPRPWVRADPLEEAVLRDLFEMFGNPALIQQAIGAAVPDCDKATKRRDRLAAELVKVEKGRGSVLNLIVKGVLTETQAEKQLAELKDREDRLRDEMDKINATLAAVPDDDAIRLYVEQVEDALGKSITVHDQAGNTYAGGNDVMTWVLMTRDDKRKLVRAVFDIPLADGRPAGVYVSSAGPGVTHRPKGWTFTLKGRLDFECVMQSASC
jgi:DNA invertase Pin-like site-specific DNA recombinase